MDNMNIKATIYDIFGYIFPGIMFLIFIGITYVQLNTATIDTKLVPTIVSYFKNINLYFLVLIVSYYIGHLTSSLSSLFIEKWIVYNKYSAYFSRKLIIDNLLSIGAKERFLEIFKSTFGFDYSEGKDFRLVINYVEKNYSNNYSTSFVFLSFYGMARNMSFIFLLFSIIQVYIKCYFHLNNLSFIFFPLMVAFIFFYEYFRYLKYFRENIASCFIL